MTQDEITQIAKDAGLYVNGDGEINHAHLGSVNEGYRKFATLVAAKEREACAKLAEEPYEFTSNEAHKIATIIRARSKA